MYDTTSLVSLCLSVSQRFSPFPICTTLRPLFLVVRKGRRGRRSCARTHAHVCADVYTLQHRTYRLHCEPWLSPADNKSGEWPLAASPRLTLSLCNPSSPPPPPHPHLLLLALLRSAPFLIVAFFVCTLFLANLFLVISLPPLPFSSSLLCCRFSFLIFTVCFSSVFFPSATEHAVSLLSLSPPILHPSWLVSYFTTHHQTIPAVLSSPFHFFSFFLQDPLLAVCLPLQLN